MSFLSSLHSDFPRNYLGSKAMTSQLFFLVNTEFSDYHSKMSGFTLVFLPSIRFSAFILLMGVARICTDKLGVFKGMLKRNYKTLNKTSSMIG